MHYQCEAVVLKTLKYGDTSLIAYLYTALHGKQVFMIKGARSPKSNMGKLLQIGSLLNIEATHVAHKQFQIIKNCQIVANSFNHQIEIKRQATAIFICEVFDKCISEPEANADLFDFIKDILAFTTHTTELNLPYCPLIACVKIAALMGFEILGTWQQFQPFLNLSDGEFVSLYDPLCANKKNSELISTLNQLVDFDGITNLTAIPQERKETLNDLLRFLSLHLPQPLQLKSPPIWQALFS
jgi:DNA repair protein RecO (recombination protein O)